MWEITKVNNPRVCLMEEASQGNFMRLKLRAGKNYNGWRFFLTEECPPTAWVHVIMKINASNDFHETLISKWKITTATMVPPLLTPYLSAEGGEFSTEGEFFTAAHTVGKGRIPHPGGPMISGGR